MQSNYIPIQNKKIYQSNEICIAEKLQNRPLKIGSELQKFGELGRDIIYHLDRKSTNNLLDFFISRSKQ